MCVDETNKRDKHIWVSNEFQNYLPDDALLRLLILYVCCAGNREIQNYAWQNVTKNGWNHTKGHKMTLDISLMCLRGCKYNMNKCDLYSEKKLFRCVFMSSLLYFICHSVVCSTT